MMVGVSRAARARKPSYFLGLAVVIVTVNIAYRLLPHEYVSETRFLGLPLVCCGDIAIGWFAFGGMAVGFVAFGGVSVGAISLGGGALGVISLGGLAIGLVAALGGGSIGYYAFGGGSVGAFAYAGCGVAKGYYVAEGGQRERLWGEQEA